MTEQAHVFGRTSGLRDEFWRKTVRADCGILNVFVLGLCLPILSLPFCSDMRAFYPQSP